MSTANSFCVVWLDAELLFEHWGQLPMELQIHALSFLSLRDIANVACCSSAMRDLAKNESLWQGLYEGIFHWNTPTGLPPPVQEEPSYPFRRNRPGHQQPPKGPGESEIAKIPSWQKKCQAAFAELKERKNEWQRGAMRMMKAGPPPSKSSAHFRPVYDELGDRLRESGRCYIQ